MKVLVVGGGVVGLCAAYFLRRVGLEVVVVDRGRCGHGTSLGNAGWITRFHGPLPAPGVVGEALRWTLRGNGPLRIRPRPDPALAGWLWRFLRISRDGSYPARLHALLALNRRTFELYDGFREDGVEFPAPTSGILFAYLTRREFDHHLEELSHLRAAGYDDPVEVLDGDAARALEPALSARVEAGLFVPADRCIRPELVTAALAAWLRADGVEIHEDTGVRRLRRASGSWSAETANGALTADSVVVAAGVASRGLLIPLGIRLPLEAGKGYSVIVTGRGSAPRRAVGLMEAKVPYTPFGESARLTGFLELGAVGASVPTARVDAIVRGAVPYFRNWRPERRLHAWAGFRPLTPDGLAFIGRLPGWEELYVAAGHGTMGFTLAPTTGEALARLVAGDAPAELAPFRPERPI
ncbi:MAG: NAD(P)/FAD-dependent oxidoreductase [Gaiellaceae bacterium]